MTCDKQAMLLYAVTDRAWTGKQTLYEQVEAALKGGATCVQLREKELCHAAFLEEALALKKLCQSYHVPFIINDDVEIAIACGADGVHIGQGDMNVSKARGLIGGDMILGVSAHTAREAQRAVEDGADYLGVGAVFATTTKEDASVLSYQTVCEICSTVSIPVVAIGGIHKKNLTGLAGSGVDGIAVVSALFSAHDIEAECRELRALSQRMVTACT